jgi:hypothetical protein
MDEDLGVRQCHTLALRASCQQQSPHRHGYTYAYRLHVGLDELHRVVDRKTRVHRAARRVDVDGDVFVRILRLKVQQLGDYEIGYLIVHGSTQEDDPLVEQPAVDVERTLASRGLLDDHWNKWAHGPRFGFAYPAGFLLPATKEGPKTFVVRRANRVWFVTRPFGRV